MEENVEVISEEDVKSFLASQKSNSASAKKKAELQEQMKRLRLEEEETAREVEKLRKELDELEKEAAKSRKKIRLELSETMEILPATLYEIDPLDNFQYDLVKQMIQLEGLIDSESSNRDATTILIEHINVFLTTFQQHSQMDTKLKSESEKVQTHARMILSGLMNEMANYDATVVRKLISEMEILASLIGDKERIGNFINQPVKKVKREKKDKTKSDKQKIKKPKGDRSPRVKDKTKVVKKKKKDKAKE